MINEILCLIRRNGARIILTQCLLVVSFVLLLISITDSLAYKIQRERNEKLYAYDTNEVYRLDVIHVNENEFYLVGEGLNAIKEKMKQEHGVDIAAYYETRAEFSELYENEEYIARNRKNNRGTIEEQFPEYAKTLFVDSSMFSFVESELTEEMLQPVIIDDKEYLPIYAGKIYEGIFSIGDLLTLARTDEKYVFSGYIEPLKWFGRVPIEEPPRILDNYFIAPFCESDKKDSVTQLSTTLGIYAFPNDKEGIFERSVMEIADAYDIKLKITKVEDIIERWETATKRKLAYYKKLAVTVTLCSVSSIVALLAVSIHLSKKDIGIKIAYGSSKRNIICNLLNSIVFQIVFGILISYVYVLARIKSTRTVELVDIYISALHRIGFPLTCVLGIIITALVCVVPMVLIRRYEPSELLK